MKEYISEYIIPVEENFMFDFMNAKQLIRCKDCKHHKYAEPGMVYCQNIVGGWGKEEGYCYLAEREEE